MAGADKNADKKVLTRKKSDGLSVKSVSTKGALVKTKSSHVVASKVPEKPVSRKNVMNLVHNVTVASPPSSASKERSASTSDIRQAAAEKPANHSRTRTRTIDPKDSILHQQKMLKLKPKEPVKEPVAFEINFEEAKKSKKIESPEEPEDDAYDYESDFESYESDFEAEISSSAASSEKASDSTDERLEDIDLVQHTPIRDELSRVDKERIDSGSYDMSNKQLLAPSSAHYDSIDDTINSHDSGISYDDVNALNKRLMSPKVQEFYKRGRELMQKITLDELNFNIYESKPIPYEAFMALYGGEINMFQTSTQTESQLTVDEVQTETIISAEMWTQFPAKFTRTGLEFINSKLYSEEKLGVGEGIADEISTAVKDESEQFSHFIDAINQFSKTESFPSSKSSETVNSFELQKFVANAALTISNVLDGQSRQQDLNPSRISISRGFSQLKFNEVEVLRDTIIKKMYTNLSVHSFIVTIHRKKSEQQNLICLWDVLSSKRPMKVFSSWSDVKCLEIHNHQREVIIGGCSDGTICLWDIQEFVEWKDDGGSFSIVKPCEIISLNQMSNDFSLDNVVALKTLPQREIKNSSSMFSQSLASQICSLHRSGSVVIWTITRSQHETAEKLFPQRTDLDYTHVTSRVKLIKNVTIDLNATSKSIGKENPRRKSAFEKTRYYFENDLFNDKVLRELQEIDTSRLIKTKNPFDDDLMRFDHCTVSLNEILVASDLNYIVAISRLNLADKTRKIFTSTSSCNSPTCIKIHPVNTNVLAVGQANGEVKFMKIYDDETSTASASTKSLRKSTDVGNVNDILAKSCAFQNIVEKEKKLYEETQALNNLESDELKAFLVNEALAEQFYEDAFNRDRLKVPFDKNIFNSFEVPPGEVRVIEFNQTGEFMFILVGRQLRIFNCWMSSEVDQQEKQNICDVKCVRGADSMEYLVNFASQKTKLRLC